MYQQNSPLPVYTPPLPGQRPSLATARLGTQLLGPPTQQPGMGRRPFPWLTYQSLMRSAKPGIAHIMQEAAQGQRGTGSNWLPLPPGLQGRPGSTSDVQPPGGSWLPLPPGMQGGTPPVATTDPAIGAPAAASGGDSGVGTAAASSGGGGSYPRPGAGGTTGEPWYGRLLRTMPLPYGANIIPGVTHQIMHGVRHRQMLDNARSTPYLDEPRGVGGNVRGNASGDPYSINGLPVDIPPDTTGQNDYGYVGGDPIVEINPADPQSGAAIDPQTGTPVDPGATQTPGRQGTGAGPNPQRGLAIILAQYPNLNNPASIRALMNGSSVQSLLGRSQFDSHAENLQLMESQSYGGEVNRVDRGREEGNISYPNVVGQRMRRIDPVTGDISLGGIYNPQPNERTRASGIRDTQAWAEAQLRLAYPGGMGG